MSSLQFTLTGTERDSSFRLVMQMADKNRVCPARGKRLSEARGGVSNFIYRVFSSSDHFQVPKREMEHGSLVQEPQNVKGHSQV